LPYQSANLPEEPGGGEEAEERVGERGGGLQQGPIVWADKEEATGVVGHSGVCGDCL